MKDEEITKEQAQAWIDSGKASPFYNIKPFILVGIIFILFLILV